MASAPCIAAPSDQSERRTADIRIRPKFAGRRRCRARCGLPSVPPHANEQLGRLVYPNSKDPRTTENAPKERYDERTVRRDGACEDTNGGLAKESSRRDACGEQ